MSKESRKKFNDLLSCLNCHFLEEPVELHFIQVIKIFTKFLKIVLEHIIMYNVPNRSQEMTDTLQACSIKPSLANLIVILNY